MGEEARDLEQLVARVRAILEQAEDWKALRLDFLDVPLYDADHTLDLIALALPLRTLSRAYKPELLERLIVRALIWLDALEHPIEPLP